MDCEVKAGKAYREFSGVEYARNGPLGTVLALLWSVLPAIGLVVGAREALAQRQTVRV